MEMTDKPICSVCIANYNGASLLEVCLDSIYRQDFRYAVEIIVHDDASTDESVDIIERKYPDVHLIRSKNNVGFCISNNRMVDEAKGEYILLLNNDAELHEHAIKTLYNYALSENVYGIISLAQYNAENGELIDVGSLFDPFLNPIPNIDKSRRNVGMVIGACMWLPKKLWVELGGFPEWFGSIAEDMYLCSVARLKGYPVIALSESGFNHWVGRSFGGGKIIQDRLKTTYRRRALSERNKSYVMIICYPGLLAYVLIPLHILLLIVEGLVLSVVKRDRRIWSDIYKYCLNSLWSNRNKVIKLRLKVKEKRQISSKKFYATHTYMPYKLIMLFKHGLPVLK